MASRTNFCPKHVPNCRSLFPVLLTLLYSILRIDVGKTNLWDYISAIFHCAVLGRATTRSKRHAWNMLFHSGGAHTSASRLKISDRAPMTFPFDGSILERNISLLPGGNWVDLLLLSNSLMMTSFNHWGRIKGADSFSHAISTLVPFPLSPLLRPNLADLLCL